CHRRNVGNYGDTSSRQRECEATRSWIEQLRRSSPEREPAEETPLDHQDSGLGRYWQQECFLSRESGMRDRMMHGVRGPRAELDTRLQVEGSRLVPFQLAGNGRSEDPLSNGGHLYARHPV